MDRLAVFGWTSETSSLLAALAIGADLEVAAVGDERSSALARARAEVRVPCFHHLREMARVADFDVALIGAVDGAGDIAEVAAQRGADLLLDGAGADGDTLSRAAETAARYGVALVVLRPWLRTRGLPAIIERLVAAPPDLLLIDAVEDRATSALIRDLVALTARIVGVDMLDIAASPAGSWQQPAAIAVQLRLAGERVASITARRGERAARGLVASSGGASVMLRQGGGTATIQSLDESAEVWLDTGNQSGTAETDVESSPASQADRLLAEARRVTEARASGIDAQLAVGEGAILRAIERALDHGFTEHIERPTRPALRLLRGGAHPRSDGSTPRRGALVLVPQR